MSSKNKQKGTVLVLVQLPAKTNVGVTAFKKRNDLKSKDAAIVRMLNAYLFPTTGVSV